MKILSIDTASNLCTVSILEDTTLIKELIVDEKLEGINLKTYGYPDKFIEHGSVDELEKRYFLDEDTIIKDFTTNFVDIIE